MPNPNYDYERHKRRPGEPAKQKCSGPCGKRLPIKEFAIAVGYKNGRRRQCRLCRAAAVKEAKKQKAQASG